MGIIGGILDVSKRSLNAQSLVVRTIGDNISNVNTPGYSRRTAELVTTQGSGIGNLITGTGVEVNRVTRAVDEFLNREFRGRISDRAGAEVRQQYLERAEQPFELENTPGHIAYELTQFFSSLQDLEGSPADIALRTQVLQRGDSLASSIKDTFNHLARLQREADDRIGEAVTEVNTLTAQVAEINGQILTGELANQENLTLRDTRDELLRKLSELVPVSTLEDASGQVLVSLSNGFALVNGINAQALEFNRAPSFGASPVGLDGGGLGNVVFGYGASDVDFNPLLAAGSGQIGSLLRVRGTYAAGATNTFQASGDLVQIASHIEAISRDLLTRFNEAYMGFPVDGATAAGGFQPSGVALDGTNPGVYGLFGATGLVDTNTNNRADDLGATAIYSSNLSFSVTDPRKFAAARDDDLATVGVTWSTGDSRNIAGLLTARDALTNFGTYGLPSVTATATIEDIYRTGVGVLGGAASKAKSDYEAYRAREDQVAELHASLTGVSLDEEFAKLVNFQRAFQGAARMVRVGDEMFTEVINLLG